MNNASGLSTQPDVEGLTALLSLRGIGRVFPPNAMALRDVTFDVRAGESIAITGASGSGKSTLLSIIGLLDRPTSGVQLLQGIDVVDLSAGARSRLRRDYIGFIFQAFHLIEHLTVTENVLYALSIKHVRGEKARQLSRHSLERVGLTEKADEYPACLSGGERQRVAIARAVAKPPRLLLCDEPTGNLDSVNSSLVIELLHQMVSSDTALIVVTHDPVVARSCQRQLHVSDGMVTEAQ